jgi:hypothetical protein
LNCGLKQCFTGPAQPGVLRIAILCGMNHLIREQFDIYGDNYNINIETFTEEECCCATRKVVVS